MKTILRNLFYTLKRFRTASVLNLLGLSTAFAAFMLIMMKASYEYNFDTCYPDSDRLVMLNFGEEKIIRSLYFQEAQSISSSNKYPASNMEPSTLPAGRNKRSAPILKIRNISMKLRGLCTLISEKLSDYSS